MRSILRLPLDSNKQLVKKDMPEWTLISVGVSEPAQFHSVGAFAALRANNVTINHIVAWDNEYKQEKRSKSFADH